MLITYPRSSIPLVAFSATQGIISALFSQGQQGLLLVPKPTVDGVQVLFQDDAGTAPVVDDGDPVGLMLDLSPNGNHATQSVSAARPLYRTDGDRHWLEFDGVDDQLVSTLLDLTQPTSHALALMTNSTAVQYVIDGDGSGGRNTIEVRDNGEALQFWSGGTVTSDLYVPHSLGNNHVYTAQASTPDFSASIDGVEYTLSDAGPLGLKGLSIGSRFNGANPLNGRIYGYLVVGVDFSDANRKSTENYLANLSGITL